MLKPVKKNGSLKLEMNSLEDLNPEWTDDEYGIDDEKMEDYIKEVFSDLGYE